MTRIISIVGGLQPSTPTIGTATAGDTTASVAFTASTYIGKGTITYTATSSPGGITATSATSPIAVTGLSNGTAYTFTVTGTTNYGVTSIASSASNSITPATQDAGAMIPIFATTVGTGTAASITFSNIPSTYTHLQLRTFAKSNNSNANDLGGMNTQFNSDATNSYTFHYTYGTGSGSPVSAGSGASATSSMVMGFTNSNNYPVSTFSLNVIDIMDYKNTNKYKTVRILGGVDGNGAGFSWATSSAYNKTNAISSMTITPWSGSFMQYSSFALYGLK